MVGAQSSQIRFEKNQSQWILSSPLNNVTAASKASQVSFALGTQNWTITGDSERCSPEGDPYTREMKLTGCRPDIEFTCSTGQCINIEDRCNQVQDCLGWDESDELNCKNIYVKNGYTKEIPPISTSGQGATKKTIPVQVEVSMILQKVVATEEEEHSISFKFQISMEWKENRVNYQNLKKDWTINTVREDDVKTLWLPLVLYANTDQQETTRLGEKWEWSTIIHILRKGDHSRNSFTEVEEAHVFKGEENSLRMEQIYTKAFQCVFKLTKYPFDTQVSITHVATNCILFAAELSWTLSHLYLICRSVTSIWA